MKPVDLEAFEIARDLVAEIAGTPNGTRSCVWSRAGATPGCTGASMRGRRTDPIAAKTLRVLSSRSALAGPSTA